MKTLFYPFLLAFALLSQAGPVTADDSKELRKQRQDAQRARQQQVIERNREINEATRSFRDYANDLKKQYREQTRDLDTEFRLREVELTADHKARVAGAETEYQKKLSALFMNPGAEFTDATIKQMQADAKAYSNAVFELKKQSAQELHEASIANEQSKNELWTEMDRMALDEAVSLGLTHQRAPVLAAPLGDGLTPQEERWNEKEKKDVARIEERSRKLLGEFRNGARLREWEIGNSNEDFRLAWEEKARLQELESGQGFYSILFMQPVQGEQFDRQKFMDEMAELNEKKKLIGIEYRKIRDKNRITRAEERKAILAE